MCQRLKTLTGGILITLSDEVPQLGAHKRGEQAAGVSGSDGLCMLGGTEEPQPVTLGLVDKPFPLCLVEQFSEPLRVGKIYGLNIAK